MGIADFNLDLIGSWFLVAGVDVAVVNLLLPALVLFKKFAFVAWPKLRRFEVEK